MDIDVRHEHERLQDLYDEFERWGRAPDPLLSGTAGGVSAWSPAQHLYHIALANGSMLKAVEVIVAGEAGSGEPVALTRVARSILESERMPSGQEAPARARPPEAPGRDAVVEALARSRRKLAAVEALLPRLGEAPGGIPHPRPVIGLMGATHWLRLARIHSEHHMAILHRIAEADG